MKKNILFLLAFSTLTGCATVKTPQISGGDSKNAIVDLSYQYGLFEKPTVDWGKALNTANTQCQSWGYKGAVSNSSPTDNCIEVNQQEHCVKHQVVSRYNCELTPQQIAKREEEYKKAVEEKQKADEIKRKSDELLLSNLKHYKGLFHCTGISIANEIAINLINQIKFDIEHNTNIYPSVLSDNRYCSVDNDEMSSPFVAQYGRLLFTINGSAYFVVKLDKSTYIGVVAN